MYYRILFAKTEAMRYTGHLDLQKAWERTLRRAGLPLAYSEGFNPRPRLALASALPLGFTSEAELLDMRLQEDLPVDEVARRLYQAAPPGIVVKSLEQLAEKPEALQNRLQAAEYTLTFLDPFPKLEAKLAAILTADSLPRERRGKPYDLRPLILHTERLPDTSDGCARLAVTMSAMNGATGRPDEFIDALDFNPHRVHIHRTSLNFEL